MKDVRIKLEKLYLTTLWKLDGWNTILENKDYEVVEIK